MMKESNKTPSRYLVSSDRDPILAQEINRVFKDLDKRLNDLEFKGKKKARVVTRAQKMLLLQHSGFLGKIRETNHSNKKIAGILSLVMNLDPDNIEGDLSDINNPKSTLKTKDNYEFLVEAFSALKMKHEKENAEKILQQIEGKK